MTWKFVSIKEEPTVLLSAIPRHHSSKKKNMGMCGVSKFVTKELHLVQLSFKEPKYIIIGYH